MRLYHRRTNKVIFEEIRTQFENFEMSIHPVVDFATHYSQLSLSLSNCSWYNRFGKQCYPLPPLLIQPLFVVTSPYITNAVNFSSLFFKLNILCCSQPYIGQKRIQRLLNYPVFIKFLSKGFPVFVTVMRIQIRCIQ